MLPKFLARGIVAAIIISLVDPGTFAMAQVDEPLVATLQSTSGVVEWSKKGSMTWNAALRGTKLGAGDSIRTGLHSRAGIRFDSGYLLRLGPNGKITFKDQKNSEIGVKRGAAHFFSRKPRRFPVIRTAHGGAGVRGTEFVVVANAQQTTISVLDGSVEATNSLGKVILTRNEFSIIRSTQAPTKQILLSPANAVQWTLSFPAVASLRDYSDFTAGASASEQRGWNALTQGNYGIASKEFLGQGWRNTMGRSLVRYLSGDLLGAHEAYQQNPSDSSPLYAAYGASLFLATGEAEQAERLNKIAKTKNTSSVDALLLAQRALLALAKNDIETANLSVSQALELNPSSSAALLSASLVSQANFQLESAREHIEKLLSIETSAFTLARKAELQLSFGQLEDAIKTSRLAVEADPGSSYAATVLGFSLLTKLETNAALESFERAIDTNSGYGLAHLGRGLALIRSGALEDGRLELENAVHLDPLVSLYRSYLGKAYFEEDKEELAGHEYQRAIELDPNDPTPYLYRSFLKRSRHRPIEALEDIQKSKALNNNRAVFRSRLMLDRDLAVRSSGLAEVYSRLGFTEVARVEALRSISSDYTNYSAHFLLSDSYATTEGFRQAGVSESLIGDLMVPVNFNRVLPSQKGETSLNEYTSLFERDVTRTQLDAIGSLTDEKEYIFEEQVLISGADERLGYSLKHVFEYSDLVDVENGRLHQFASKGQYQLSTKDTLLWDVFAAKQELSPLTVESEARFLRGQIGYHHEFGPESDLVAVAYYQDIKFEDNFRNFRAIFLEGINFFEGDIFLGSVETPLGTTLDENFRRDFASVGTELQYVWSSEYLNLIAGGRLRWARRRNQELGSISSGGFDDSFDILVGFPLESSARVYADSQRGYLYSTVHAAEWLDLNAGISYSSLKIPYSSLFPPFVPGTTKESSWGPKAGFTVYLVDGLSMRGAYFEGTGEAGIDERVELEPTFVGGFNQVFDDFSGSHREFFGIGVDYQLSDKTFIGASFEERNIEQAAVQSVGILNADLLTDEITFDPIARTSNLSIEENIIQAYWYQVICKRIAATAQYSWVDFDEPGIGLGGMDTGDSTKTHRLNLTAQYFDPSGFFSFARAFWRDQEQDLTGVADLTTEQLWQLNLGMGYEFDKRHGRIVFEVRNVLDEDFGDYREMRGDTDFTKIVTGEVRVTFNF